MDKTNLNFRRPGTIVSGSYEPILGANEEKADRKAHFTLESRIPATIRAYGRTGEYTSPRIIDLREPTANIPDIAPFEPLRPKTLISNSAATHEIVLSAIRRMEACEAPQRFLVTRTGEEPFWFVAADGMISPTVEGRPLDLEGESNPNVIRTAQIAYIWTLLCDVAERSEELHVEDLIPEGDRYVPTQDWLAPVEFSYHQTATTAPEALPLVLKLRELLAGGRASIILLRRARDLHPLLRVHNIIGAEALTMRNLETMVRFGETMSRQLAVMSSAAVPGANRWFGATDSSGMSVISVRDLTLVGAFSLDRLGRFLLYADKLEDALQKFDSQD